MAIEPEKTIRVDWNVQNMGAQLSIRPMVQSETDGELYYELSTQGNPAQKIRQAGRVRLKAATAQSIGALSVSPRGSKCLLRLTLRLNDNSTEAYEIDPCSNPGLTEDFSR